MAGVIAFKYFTNIGLLVKKLLRFLTLATGAKTWLNFEHLNLFTLMGYPRKTNSTLKLLQSKVHKYLQISHQKFLSEQKCIRIEALLYGTSEIVFVEVQISPEFRSSGRFDPADPK
jgi:hypothetical protein